MKAIQLAGLLPIFALCGCSTMTNTEKGVGAGAVLGGVTGGIVGNALGNTGAGAIVGAGLGGISGGLIGNAVDESEKKAEAKAVAAAAAVQQSRGPLGLTDIAQMSQSGVSESVIISQIRSSGSVFRLSSNDTIWLKQNGVSDNVVREMLVTGTRYPRQVYTAAPVYAAPVYVVEPPPPVHVGFGFGYHRRW